jgi:hypothetical protein
VDVPWLSHLTANCRSCGREREEGELFSRRGKCEECGEGRMIENRRQLRAHDGPWFVHWRRAVAAAVGAILLDELATDAEEADHAASP